MSDYIDNKSNERPAVPIPPSTDTDVNTVSADDSSVHVQKENDTDVTAVSYTHLTLPTIGG